MEGKLFCVVNVEPAGESRQQKGPAAVEKPMGPPDIAGAILREGDRVVTQRVCKRKKPHRRVPVLVEVCVCRMH